jgi:hypothetical protein
MNFRLVSKTGASLSNNLLPNALFLDSPQILNPLVDSREICRCKKDFHGNLSIENVYNFYFSHSIDTLAFFRDSVQYYWIVQQ